MNSADLHRRAHEALLRFRGEDRDLILELSHHARSLERRLAKIEQALRGPI